MKIISLNTWNHHEWDARKHALIRYFKDQNADVLFLQEINEDDSENRYNHLGEEINESLEYPYIETYFPTVFSKVNKPSLGDRIFRQGLAVFSKNPIEVIKRHKLIQHPDDPFSRGFMLVKINGIFFVNIHFSNRDPWAVQHWIETEEACRSMQPVYIGDFNFTKHALPTFEVPDGYVWPYKNNPYVSHPSSGESFDQVLLPQHLEMHSFSCDDISISDHRPIRLSVSIREQR